MSKKALGKGIGALFIGEEPARTQTERDPAAATELPIASLQPNPFQPRKDFPEEALRELAQSIRHQGVLQPILVEEGTEGHYTIIAGERRFRAAKLAGLDRIPVIVKHFSETEKLEIALVENIQRENLSPLEEALAYKRLMDIAGLNQEEVSQKVGKNRSTVANSLRLLKLPEEIQKAVGDGTLSAGHARAILSVNRPEDQMILFRLIIKNGISVREAEQAASDLNQGKKTSEKKEKQENKAHWQKIPELRAIEEKLIETFGTRVEVKGDNIKGKIEVAYFSTEDFTRLLSLWGMKPDD
jgi:ParB family transcriptional regulator, chromosome partitioning protein